MSICLKNFLGEGRGVEPASALASPKTESGATDTLGYANNKREAEASLLLLVDLRGVEPLSENRSMRLSPGASSDQISLWTTSDAKSDTGSHFVRDRLNGEPPMHGHRYMTLSLGSRYSQGERAAL